MAIYHLNVRGCSKSKGQSASAKSDYINREDKYTKNKDDLIYSASGNMPSFVKDNPKEFWKSADEFERANARVCTEIKFALPRELNLEQQKELITEFIIENIDNDNHKLTYSYAIHNDKDNHNPHCHLIFSERNNDGIERTAEQYFRRANNKNPEKGGAKKSEYAHKKEFVQEVRTSWRESANVHLAKAGFKNTIDERTLEAQGIDRESPRRLNRIEFKKLRQMEADSLLIDKQTVETDLEIIDFKIKAADDNARNLKNDYAFFKEKIKGMPKDGFLGLYSTKDQKTRVERDKNHLNDLEGKFEANKGVKKELILQKDVLTEKLGSIELRIENTGRTLNNLIDIKIPLEVIQPTQTKKSLFEQAREKVLKEKSNKSKNKNLSRGFSIGR